MKRNTAILLSVLMAASVPAYAEAETETSEAVLESDLEYVKDKGTLVVGITDFAPMDYKDDNGEWIGFDADMAKAFAESLGVEAEFVEIEWDYKALELDNKNIDCVWNGMTITDEVLSMMKVSNAYCNNAQVVVVPADAADAYQDIESLSDLSFAVEAGSAGEKEVKALELSYTPVTSQADALMEVAAGTSDAAVIDALMAAAMVGEGTGYESLTYTIGLNEEEYGIGFRTGSDLCDALNDFLLAAYEDGSLMACAELYGVQAAVIEQYPSDLAYVLEKGTLVVGITDFEPMDYKDDNGEWIGFDADMAKAFAESLGVEAEFVEIEWDYKALELDNKNIDCVWNGMTITDEVMSMMKVSNAYCNNAQVVIVSADDADAYQDVDSLSTLSFAVEAGSAGEKEVKALGLNYTAVTSQADALMEVAAGTSDAAVIDALMAAAMVGEGTGYADLTYTVGLNEEEYGVGFRKGSDLCRLLNQFFAETYADGSMLECAELYGVQAAVIEQ